MRTLFQLQNIHNEKIKIKYIFSAKEKQKIYKALVLEHEVKTSQ